MLLSASNISKSFGDNILFKDLSFSIEKGEKLGIVGKNGCGKSTLLKILVKEIEADSGNISYMENVVPSYLSQYQNKELKGNIFDIVISSQKELLDMEKEMRKMEDSMSLLEGEELKKHLEEYHNLSDEFEKRGGYELRSRAEGILKGLGFFQEDFNKDFSTLSGGQMTRISLARNLLKKPKLLILDEPTNHLDIKAIEWLEKFLLKYDEALIIVSHDRYFLDNVITSVLDLSDKKGRYYKGNYSEFLDKKKILVESEIKAAKKQQDKIKHETEVIETLQRFNREKSIKRAESRKKALNKIEIIEAPKEESDSMRLSFKAKNLSGNDVLKVEGLSKEFDGRFLFKDISFFLQRGERMAIIGDNGTGKTTILKIINNLIPFDKGIVKIGANVDIGYFDQTQENLNDDNTIFSELSNAYPTFNNTKIRNTLSYFDFKGDEVNKYVSELSGGERARLSFSKLMLKDANFLILDEPTNHLDIRSKEILEGAFKDYEGTILFVSHDRFFIDKIANRIMLLENKTIKTYIGNYSDYIHEREKEKSKESSSSKSKNYNTLKDKRYVKMDFAIQKQEKNKKQKLIRQGSELEDKISELENKLTKLEDSMALPENAVNSAKLNDISKEIKKINEVISDKMSEWEKIEKMISEMSS